MGKYKNAEDMMICDGCFHNTVCRLDGNEILEWCSARVPSADVRENIHGDWETVNEDWGVYECSVCQHEFMIIAGDPKDNSYNFCPNCGADMRGDPE